MPNTLENELKNINWRTIGVKRERSHEPTMKKLVSGSQPAFRFLKDLMVFAAIVGHKKEEKRALEGETIEIILDTYATDEQDGFVYLLGLLDLGDANVLRDERLTEPVKVFEEYCNAGLYEIGNWLEDNPGDLDGIETLLSKIYDELVRTSEAADEDPTEIDMM